jgi:HSP20 family protein
VSVAEQQPAADQVTISPNVNIYETGTGYILEADLPGVGKDGVDLFVEDNVLTIIGRRNRVASESQEVYRESVQADYRRAFELDPAIDAAKIGAKMEQGVLTVTLPKGEKAIQRKIEITG